MAAGRRRGCALALLKVVCWAGLAFLPLLAVGDLLGPVFNVHWELFPGRDGTSFGDAQQVKVPAGTRFWLDVDQVDANLPPPGFRPAVLCSYRDGGQPWTALPSLAVPQVVGTKMRRGVLQSPDTHEVPLTELMAGSGALSVRCAGSQVVDLWREDPALRQRLSTTVTAVRSGWVLLITALFWMPFSRNSPRRWRITPLPPRSGPPPRVLRPGPGSMDSRW